MSVETGSGVALSSFGELIRGKELDYTKYQMTHGSYQLTKTIQQTGYTTTTLTTSGGQESIFELSPKVYNFAESYLEFTATPVASGADFYNRINLDGLTFIRQITLYTRSGLFLADIPDVGNYMNMTMRRNFKIDDVQTWDKEGGKFEGLRCSNVAAGSNYRYDGTTGTTAYLEPSYLRVGGKNTADPVINVQMNLNRIIHSIFSQDKDLYFGGEVLYLRIVWNPTTKIAFIGKSATDPTGDVAAYAGNIAITNLVLYMAVEQNQVIENEVRNKVLSAEGLNIVLPYVYQNKISLGGTSQNLSIKYSRAHGSKLLKIYWAPYSATESSNTTYDHDNLAGAKVSQFYTTVNNIRTSQFNYNCDGDDYRMQRKRLQGSCILSSDEYYYNWVWIEDFTNNYSMVDKPLKPAEDNYVDGMPLDMEVKYDVFTNTANANYNHYVYAICQKNLVINSSGISLV